MTTWVPAPAAKALLTQATIWCPTRSTASDGLKGDAAHAARESFHNPQPFDLDGDGRPESVVTAVDLTHDPAHGMDVHAWIRWAVARRDRRISQAISRGEIWTKARAAEGWRRYTGSNRHDKHGHVTVDPAFLNDVSPWFAGWFFDVRPPVPLPPPAAVLPETKKRRHMTFVHIIDAQAKGIDPNTWFHYDGFQARPMSSAAQAQAIYRVGAAPEATVDANGNVLPRPMTWGEFNGTVIVAGAK